MASLGFLPLDRPLTSLRRHQLPYCPNASLDKVVEQVYEVYTHLGELVKVYHTFRTHRSCREEQKMGEMYATSFCWRVPNGVFPAKKVNYELIISPYPGSEF